MSVEAEIRKILEEKVNPILAGHYGAAELTGYDDGVAYVRLTGACSACPSAQFTIEDVVRAEVKAALSQVDDVVLDTAVSDDIIDFAKKILNKEVEV
ncbi:MAG: NifU family protein [Clostridiales Family XIII bacterium]|nr:NifU family protein [Clostridiales Family XIII bacterium]